MSGHNKWSSIKHRKGAQDAKRGKIFTKLIKEIVVAARINGDPSANPRLRTAIANARSESMPKDNITRAIKKGMGATDGENYEEITYEGYGPYNVAIIVETLTDNRNRTIAAVRHAFNKTGGNLGSPNSVQYMFQRVGSIGIEKSAIDEDTLTEIVLDAGAEDLNTDNPEEYEVITDSTELDAIRTALEENNIPMTRAGIVWNPENRTVLDDRKKAESVLKLIDMLEDDDDVQKVHSNFDITEEIAAQLS